MKKVLALVLAVLMLATVAFAADVWGTGTKVPGKKIKISRDSGSKHPVADETLVKILSENDILDKDIEGANYAITGIRYNEGKNYIESITINDADGEVVVKLKQDYSNTKSKTFEVEFTLKGKGKYRTTEGGETVNRSVRDVKFSVKGSVSYDKTEVKLGTDENNDIDNLSTRNGGLIDFENSVVKFVKQDEGDTSTGGTIKSSAAWANYTEDYDDITLEVRVYDGNQFYLNVSNDANSAVLKANADTDAEMFFYEFEGTPTFDATATLSFNDADKDHFVYSIKDGRVTKVGKYDDDYGCWVVKARTLGAYVVSDKELVSAANATPETPATTNPDTGANDVVGIATALAAVALVSAAAVSLKK